VRHLNAGVFHSLLRCQRTEIQSFISTSTNLMHDWSRGERALRYLQFKVLILSVIKK
jgi:hypothetical protein